MSRLLPTLCLLVCCAGLAAEPDKTTGPEAAEAAPTAESAKTTEPEAAPTAESDSTAEPAADNLRNRTLGDAFKNFRPSEEISADNAVTFPVDI